MDGFKYKLIKYGSVHCKFVLIFYNCIGDEL